MRPSTQPHVTDDSVSPHSQAPCSRAPDNEAPDNQALDEQAAQRFGDRSRDPSDPAQTATELAHSLVPRFADHVAIHLTDEIAFPGGSGGPSSRLVLHRVAVVDGPGSTRHDVMRPGEILRLSPNCPVLALLAAGETVYYSRLDDFTADHLADQFGGARNISPLKNRSVLLLPLIAGDTMLGHALLIREPERPPFEPDEIVTAAELARWAARCIDTNRLYSSERRHWIMPESRMDVACLEVRHCCLPQGRAESVGGDWCDVIAQPGGEVALVVGDVMGHGAHAASMMNQCRTIVRTLATLGLPPDEVLRRFDELTDRSGDDGYLATCICVSYDPQARKCHVANAGHIPAVLIQPDGRSEILDTPTGMPIGIDGVTFEARTFDAEDGSAFALCSDGFIERHGRDIETGLSDLRSRLAGPRRPLDDMYDELLRGLDIEDRRDDVTLLIGRFLGTG